MTAVNFTKNGSFRFWNGLFCYTSSSFASLLVSHFFQVKLEEIEYIVVNGRVEGKGMLKFFFYLLLIHVVNVDIEAWILFFCL